MKPIIGVVQWPYIDKDNDKIYEVPNKVIEKISNAGGNTIGIFPTQICNFHDTSLMDINPLSKSEKSDLIQLINICDAIIIPGAIKVYEYQKFIQDYTLIKDIPFLGICGGMQLMTYPSGIEYNKAKNKLISNLELHNSLETYAHKIRIIRDTKLYSILKKDVIEVNSKHNYTVANTDGYRASAYSEDYVVEAIESKKSTFHIGLQWHPELLDDENSNTIFDSLINEAIEYKLKRK